jgi:hypothetical protein
MSLLNELRVDTRHSLVITLDQRESVSELQAPTRMACSVFSLLKSGREAKSPEARGAYYTQAPLAGKRL